VTGNGRQATVHAQDLPVLDSLQFLGPNNIPATISFSVRWEATGPAISLGSGKAVSATDPAAFLGEFAPARATGSISGDELGFSFRSDQGLSTDRGYAELGRERNGVLL
jgi:hypothetical protein